MRGFEQALGDIKQIDASERCEDDARHLGLHALFGDLGGADDFGEIYEADDNWDKQQNNAKPKGARHAGCARKY